MEGQVLQQHKEAVSGKRPDDFEAEHDVTRKRQKVDSSEEGEVDSSEDEEKDETGSYTIQSVRGGRIGKDGIDGKFLRARDGENPKKFAVDFNGTNPDDPTAEFHLEKNGDKDTIIFRYSVDGNNYYLAISKSGKVKLRKLGDSPKNEKYFFEIERTGGDLESPVTFKSLKTGEYLHCDEDGRAFMKEKMSPDDNGDGECFFVIQLTGKRSRERPSAGVDEVEGRPKEADHTECCTIQSLVRTGQNTRGGKDGNLLKSKSDGEAKISVEFTGTDPKNDASVFHLEACDGIDGNALRYSVKNDNYYLRVYRNGRVKLRKLVNFPTNNKYFFSVESVGRIVGCPVTFRSLNSDEYLYCDEDGKAFMREVTASDGHGQPKDRQTWFCCHRNDQSDGSQQGNTIF